MTKLSALALLAAAAVALLYVLRWSLPWDHWDTPLERKVSRLQRAAA